MKTKFLAALCALVVSTSTVSAQQTGGLVQTIVTEEREDGAFPMVDNLKKAAPVIYDAASDNAVKRAICDLITDVEKVTGVKPAAVAASDAGGIDTDYVIVVGTVGSSKQIDALIRGKQLNGADLKGKWESFVITALENPKHKGQRMLVIAGSDRRGTIYGIYELSRQLGVSPWYWWNDVPVKTKAQAYVRDGYYASGEPKVKYRGIFINDEEPCFGGWANEKFGGVNSKMYAHMFELILRLRGNYFWPAMWGKAFNEDDPMNPKVADEYGIVMGTSHHEPMMRAQKEWSTHRGEYGNGEWNYQTNKDALLRFWEDGLSRNRNYDNIVTMGMRGDGDEPMKDLGSAEANFRQLEQIMADQREVIKKVTGRPASETPQMWALYSEVLEYYDQGMKVPDDMIILLCDDNWGNARRLPDLNGTHHKGGYGMYYHVDLHGAPRAYQWLNMTQIPHMWEQLQLTYAYGVDKIWILNVGDLKPNEYPTDFFMQMAWNPTSFTADNLGEYARLFAAEHFGEAQATEAADILTTACKYNARVTAEMLDINTYNLQSGELKQVRDEYMALEARALRQYLKIAPEYRDTYMEMILHPVRAMSNLYDMYHAVAMNRKLAAENDTKANYWADYAEACFDRDAEYTDDYHSNVAGGKWNHIMAQTHIGYTSWDEPRGGNIRPKVERVDAANAESGGYVFTSKAGVTVMEGEHYFDCKADDGTAWTVIPDLGRTASAVALMPYTVEPQTAEITYKMKSDGNARKVRLRMYFDSTLPFRTGGHNVAARFNDGVERQWNINADLNWEHNYSKMYPAGAARMIETVTEFELPASDDGIYTLHVRPLNPGVVIYKIIVDEGGYVRTRLLMNESPYTR